MGYTFATDSAGFAVTPEFYGLFSINPFYDQKGDAVLGAYYDGKSFQCRANATTSTPACVRLTWPALWAAYDRDRGLGARKSWHGSLLEGKRDPTGLQFRRNRLYDPAAGRFTQEDPIGLAGGINLYGFANGDPVNFSDPFGLAPCRKFGNCLQGDGGVQDVYEASERENLMFGHAFATLADPRSSFADKLSAGIEIGSFGMGGVGSSARGLGNIRGGTAKVESVLQGALRWLGRGYKEIKQGVFRSADNTRQFRMKAGDLVDPKQGPHVHFESVGPNGRTITENSHVQLEDF